MLHIVEDFTTFAPFWRRFSIWAEHEEIDLALILKAISMQASQEEAHKFTSAMLYFQTHILEEEEREKLIGCLKTRNQGSDTVDMSEGEDE